MAKGKFNEALHPRGPGGKFAPSGTSRREKAGAAIGSKIADVRVAVAQRSAKKNQAAVAKRNTRQANYVPEYGDTPGLLDKQTLAAKNNKNRAKAKKATATASRISNRRKGSK